MQIIDQIPADNIESHQITGPKLDKNRDNSKSGLRSRIHTVGGVLDTREILNVHSNDP